MDSFAAIVLAGGSGTRLGGVDKAGVSVGARSLLECTLDALVDAERIVVVGPRRSTQHDVTWTMEDPPGGGPVAGLDAGLRELANAENLVAVLAVDHPYLTADTVGRLLRAVRNRSVSGAVLTADDSPQWLLGVWRADDLRNAIPADPYGVSARSVLSPLQPYAVKAIGAEASDVDTVEDLHSAGGQVF